MAALTQRPLDLEAPIRTIGTDLAARMPKPRAVSAARVERRMTDMLVRDPALRAALFRFVDVRPACETPWDVTRHLHELLQDAEDSSRARRASCRRAVPRAAWCGTRCGWRIPGGLAAPLRPHRRSAFPACWTAMRQS